MKIVFDFDSLFSNLMEETFFAEKPLEYIEEHCLDQTFMKAGAADFLEKLMLKGIKLGLISSHPERITKKILLYFDIYGYFYFTGTAGQFCRQYADSVKETKEPDESPVFVIKSISEVKKIKECMPNAQIFSDFREVLY